MIKMQMKVKNRSHKYDINRLSSRHGHKFSKYKKCPSMTMLICINPFVPNASFLYPMKTSESRKVF